MKILTDDKELFKSETFLVLGGKKAVVEFGDSTETIRIIFNFSENRHKKKAWAEWNAVDSQTLNIALTNWNDPIRQTLNDPAEIGIFKKRQLFMVFEVAKLKTNASLRRVTLFLYLGKEVQNADNS